MLTTCPHDQSPLLPQGESTPSIYRCETCYGLWFSRHAVAEVLGHLPTSSVIPTLDSVNPPRLSCPEDGKPLARFLVDGVELDICSSCEGVWFDRGEIEYIRAKRAGTLPNVPQHTESGIPRTLMGAAGDAGEKLRGVVVLPDVVVLTTDVGMHVASAALSNPELTGQVAEAVGGGVANLAGAMPDVLGAMGEAAPDVVGGIFEAIFGAFSN